VPTVQHLPELSFLSELYAQDAPAAVLLTEYPSSNSDETQFQNRSNYIIHDPFPPPKRELLKVLGPHHLMCGWGRHLKVTSEIPPPPQLLEHWRNVFGIAGCPIWQPLPLATDGAGRGATLGDIRYITLFPHESLPPHQQVIPPDTYYQLHSKAVLAEIACPQAAVLDFITPPCIVKLSHGYAGLGNFVIRDQDDEARMRRYVAAHWPTATWVANAIIENITGDFGVQFYLGRDGSLLWLGFTEQHFDANQKWCGGTYSQHLQAELFESLCAIVKPVGEYLQRRGYFGLVGVDVLRDSDNRFFLVDLNPRLTGITPFLMASRIFAREQGWSEGLYQASCRFPGSLEQLLDTVAHTRHARALVLSACEQTPGTPAVTTLCHLAVNSDSQARNREVLKTICRDPSP
jgi:hypothetical protein